MPSQRCGKPGYRLVQASRKIYSRGMQHCISESVEWKCMEQFQSKASYIPSYILCLLCRHFDGNNFVGTASLFVESDDGCRILVNASDKRRSSSTYLTLRPLMSYIYIYMEHPFLMFLDHTQRRSTVGRTPLDE